MGSSGTDFGKAVTTDTAGNVYVVGQFTGTVDFDPGPGATNLSTGSGGLAFRFVAKYSPSGSLIWAKNMGGIPSSSNGNGIFVDASGNVYTTGYMQGTVDLDPGPGVVSVTPVGAADGYITKLDSSGNHVWSRRIGGSGTDEGTAVVADSLGNVYVTGSFSGTVDFDPGTGVTNLTSAGGTDVYLLKLNSTGSFVWARATGGISADVGASLALDSSGNAYVTGSFQGSSDFDPEIGATTLTSNGGQDAFVWKLTAGGSLGWVGTWGNFSTDLGSGIAIDGSGNVLVTGQAHGNVDFDPGPGTAVISGAGGVFVLKLMSTGDFIWARSLQHSTAWNISVDGAGNAYIAGTFSATRDFDAGGGTAMLSSAGGNDGFVLRWNASGDFGWARAFGGTETDQSFGVAVNSSGDVFATGYFNGTADFDSGPGASNIISAGGTDAFVTRFTQGTPPSATVTVNNVPPTLSGFFATPTEENSSTTLSGTINDAGILDTHVVSVAWGDPNDSAVSTFSLGSTNSLTVNQVVASSTDSAALTITAVNTAAGTIGVSVQHRYRDDGLIPGNSTATDTSTITITVTDDDSGIGSATANVVVSNAPPTMNSLIVSSPVDAGARATISGIVTDPGSGDAHQIQINWGDGTVETIMLDVLYGVSSATESLYRIDPATGVATLIAPIQGRNLSFAGAAFFNGELYVSGTSGSDGFKFGKVDLVTGQFTPVNNMDGDLNWWGLATDESTGLLYTVDSDTAGTSNNFTLKATNAGTGAVTPIAGNMFSSSFQSFAGLAYNPTSGLLYGAGQDGNLYLLNKSTGARTLVGNMGVGNGGLMGLEFVAQTQSLYLTQTVIVPGNISGPTSLYKLNLSTGAATLVGATGANTIDGLAWPSQDGAAHPIKKQHTYAHEGNYTVTVTVTDDDGGTTTSSVLVNVEPALSVIDVVDISPDPRNIAVNSVDVVFSELINLSTFDVSDLTLTRNGLAVSLLSIPLSFQQVNGTTYRVSGMGSATTTAGNYQLIVNAAGITELDGNFGMGTASDTWLQDTVGPTSRVSALVNRQLTKDFTVQVTGADGGSPASGIASYDVYVAVNGGGWQFWRTIPASSPSYVYSAQSNQTVAFYSTARDVAGNTEMGPQTIEASTYVPDLDAPVTQVDSVNATTATFSLQFSGTDTGGSALSFFDVFVAIDGGAAQKLGTFNAGAPNAGGVYSGSSSFQAISDGIVHSYRFFSVGVDQNANRESVPTDLNQDQLVTVAYAVPASLQITAFDVQQGAIQRSFVRYLDMSLNTASGVSELIASINDTNANNDRVKLVRYGLDGSVTNQTVNLSAFPVFRTRATELHAAIFSGCECRLGSLADLLGFVLDTDTTARRP